MSWQFQLLGCLLVAALSAQFAPVSSHYTSPECGFEFDYPGEWVASVASDKKPCRVRLRPRDFAARMNDRDVDVYTLELGLEPGDFLAVAANNAFDFVRGKWVTLGRQGMHSDAEVVLTERWHGLRGASAAGCYHEAGGYAGVCEQQLIVLRDESDNIWSMTGGPQSASVFEAILATFRFLEP